jgi:hypothetical protein
MVAIELINGPDRTERMCLNHVVSKQFSTRYSCTALP